MFRLLLAQGADPNAVKTQGDGEKSALCAALRCSRSTMLKELLEHGADPSAGESAAVVAAAEAGNVEGMQLLIQYGANIHVQCNVPGLALHKAAYEMDVNMVKLLLAEGVDVNAAGGPHG